MGRGRWGRLSSGGNLILRSASVPPPPGRLPPQIRKSVKSFFSPYFWSSEQPQSSCEQLLMRGTLGGTHRASIMDMIVDLHLARPGACPRARHRGRALPKAPLGHSPEACPSHGRFSGRLGRLSQSCSDRFWSPPSFLELPRSPGVGPRLPPGFQNRSACL